MNQLPRRHELDLHRLVKAGEELERAQREAVAGTDDGTAFTAARREEGTALRRLGDAARNILESAGHRPSAATLNRIDTSLRGAAATPAGRELLKRGRLTEDLEPPGFEAFATVKRRQSPSSTGTSRAKRRTGSKAAREIESLRQSLADARADARQRADVADDLERHAREADRAAKKARREAESARKTALRADERARGIDAKLKELQS